ncbi:MAG TPA: TauD/TfdA family dioxygenase [Burkholderiales bacterium]|nr:TauD/TfdA family dioxygenase [Burkholderiales bacterium]
MQPITPQRISEANAWKSSDFAKDSRWSVTLGTSQIAELESAANACIARGLREIDITPRDFVLPTFAREIEAWANEINRGRGFLLVRGLRQDYSNAQIRAMFWGIGLYLGSPISQNSYGDMLGEVFDEGVKMGSGKVRGYRTNQQLMFHTDRCDIVGLLCQRPSKTGGLSSIVSSTRIYNEIAQTHPEYLGPLFNGYICINVEEGGDLSTYRMPVFSECNGVISARILRNTVETARRMGHAQYNELETAALDCLDTLANREDMRLDMMLKRGDMQFINNYTTLHARTEFEDFADPLLKRHMVRLWLVAHGQRRMVDQHIFRDYSGVAKTLQR